MRDDLPSDTIHILVHRTITLKTLQTPQRAVRSTGNSPYTRVSPQSSRLAAPPSFHFTRRNWRVGCPNRSAHIPSIPSSASELRLPFASDVYSKDEVRGFVLPYSSSRKDRSTLTLADSQSSIHSDIAPGCRTTYNGLPRTPLDPLHHPLSPLLPLPPPQHVG